MDKLKMMSMDKVSENIEKIKALFPNCVTEVKRGEEVEYAIDFDVLKQELSKDLVDEREERYQMTWPDKKKSVVLANSPINKTLRPCREESVDFDNTENLYIEGDNLEVLKLLQETYLGKIKMIYIDPPYNTGNDSFVYNDAYSMSEEEFLSAGGYYDEDGNRVIDVKENNESNGRFHTDWLNMIYPTLRLARDLLSDDGVIFISIDDNEQANLKKVCDEIFGIQNFIAQFPRVTKRGGKSTDTYAKNHDYVIVYTKNINEANIIGIPHIDEGFKYKDKYFDQRGAFKLNQTLDYNTLQYNKTMDYELEINGRIFVPGGSIEEQRKRHMGIHGNHDWVWRWSKSLFDFGYKNDWIVISKSGRIYTKTYSNASIEKNADGSYYIEYQKRTRPISTLDFVENKYSNDNSNKEITSIMGTALFDYVKPTALIKQIMKTCTNQNSIILDFFSGSATTAHAVMQLNAEDGGKRKFIMVQIPDITYKGKKESVEDKNGKKILKYIMDEETGYPVVEKDSEARKAGYYTITQIGKERIRRAGKKIKEESPLTTQNLDTGFRVLKLDSSNMLDVYYNSDRIEQASIFDYKDNIKADRSAEDLLFQIMLDMGVTLSAKIEEKEINGTKVFAVDGDFLVACFADNLTDDTLTEIAKLKPRYAAFRDSSFANDSVAKNCEQIFATYSPNTKCTVV